MNEEEIIREIEENDKCIEKASPLELNHFELQGRYLQGKLEGIHQGKQIMAEKLKEKDIQIAGLIADNLALKSKLFNKEE